MHILEITRSVDPRDGGVIAGITAVAKSRAKRGVRTTVASLDAPDAFDPASFPFGWVGLGPGHLAFGYSSKWVPWLVENARKFDGIAVNGIWGYQAYGTWRALASRKIPYIAFTHGMLDPWFRKQYPLKHLKKWLYWPWASYRFLRDAAAVCFTCDQERTLARHSFWLYRANEAVVGYGIDDPPQADPKQVEAFYAKVPEAKGKRVVLFLSRIHVKKGCDLLIQAFATALSANPSWHLVIAGPDQEGQVANLQHLAAQAGVGTRISWPGMLEGDAKWGAFRAADVFCLPSHSENFGLVVAEALACKCPVLISDKVNICTEIVQSKSGLVAPDTLEGTTDLLQRWSNLSSQQVEEMRSATSCAFVKHFHIDTASRNIDSLLESLAAQTTPANARIETQFPVSAGHPLRKQR